MLRACELVSRFSINECKVCYKSTRCHLAADFSPPCETHLCKTLLTVVLEMFRVDINLVFVNAVGLGELDGVLDKLLHFY